MARVREVELHEVPDDVKPIYSRFAQEYGPFMNQVRVFANRPPVLKNMMGMLLELKAEALLSKRYLEIALVVVSKLNECVYCVAHHNPRLVEQGLPPKTVDRILEPDCPGLDPIDRLVRDYAVQVTERPQYIRDAMFDALRRHFTEEQIVELTVRTALCGFFNRVGEALQIEMEPGVMEDMLSAGFSAESLEPHAPAIAAAGE